MAASAAKLEYGEPFKASLGGRFVTLTELKIAGEAEEYKKGGILLEYSKLGLPDALVDLAFLTGGSFLDEKSEKQFDAAIVKEKLILYASGKEKTFNGELSEAEGKALKGYYGFVVALGR
jgi:hypothetical protein